MAGIYTWVSNITFFLIFITIVNNLLPNKKYERYLKLFAGMILILLVLKPLTSSIRLEDTIAYYFESFTFKSESEDFKKEIMGMENQRLQQMINQYEKAVAEDVEAMAEEMGFSSNDTKITIEGNREHDNYGKVILIRMGVSRQSEDTSNEIGNIQGVEPVTIGLKQEAKSIPAPDEGLNKLRRKVEEYYGLQTEDVEIQLEE